MGKISSQKNYIKVYIGKWCSPTYLVPVCRFDWQMYEGSGGHGAEAGLVRWLLESKQPSSVLR